MLACLFSDQNAIRGGITFVRVAAQPQLVFLDMFCVFCVRFSARKTHNMYYNVWSPQATHLYGSVTPSSCKPSSSMKRMLSRLDARAPRRLKCSSYRKSSDIITVTNM